MKKTEQQKILETMLYSGQIIAGGFMGTDKRPLDQMISDDLAILEQLKITPQQLAEKMAQITELAKDQLGNPKIINENLTASVEDYRGQITCPWPHPCGFRKRITTATNPNTNETIQWTDLSIHMIAEHNFFEGKGSPYRIEPEIFANMIF